MKILRLGYKGHCGFCFSLLDHSFWGAGYYIMKMLKQL